MRSESLNDLTYVWLVLQGGGSEEELIDDWISHLY